MFDLPAHRHYAETRLMASFEPCEERDMAVMLFDACEAVEALQAEVERLTGYIETIGHGTAPFKAENARLRKALENVLDLADRLQVSQIYSAVSSALAPQTGGDDANS